MEYIFPLLYLIYGIGYVIYQDNKIVYLFLSENGNLVFNKNEKTYEYIGCKLNKKDIILYL
jgi:hypothetical protein